MKSIKNSWIEVVLQGIFWAATAWLLTNSFSVQMRQRLLINGVETVHIVQNHALFLQILTCIAIGGLVFYATIWRILWRKTLEKQAILALIAIFGVGILLANGVVLFSFGIQQPPLPTAVAVGIVTFYFTVAVAYGIAKLLYLNHARQQQLLLDKKQTELTLLRNQLQPHFLFNALNNLLSMVKPTENPKLVDSFERLSQLLRYVVEETQSEKVPIRKEILFLENYIELQKLRFNDDEITINLNIKGQFLDQLVEPVLYITFLENAFKYGTEPEQKSVIDLNFEVENAHQINFNIKNEIMMPDLVGNKTGIESTRKRLELIYPNKHQLIIEKTKYFFVNLNIETQ